MKKINKSNNPNKIDKKNLTLYIGILVLVSVLSLILHLLISGYKGVAAKNEVPVPKSDCPSSLTLIRENNKALTHALYLADIENESPKYNGLKDEITNTIRQWEQSGKIKTASIYVREMNWGSWMSIDGEVSYFPGSLMKVPIMIYYLKNEEEHPGTLNKELLYIKPEEPFPSQAYIGDSIRSGKKYKISELLEYMIVESDNNATLLLARNIDPKSYLQVFSNLSIPPDEVHDLNYIISPREYAKFFRILYSSTYLEKRWSEYALELLTRSKFTDGIAKKLPTGLTIARKFGEHGKDGVMDFSESAIVYRENNPYLICIMTRGNNTTDQCEFISEISQQVYESLNKN
jgi:beta-lactamase class A